MKKLLLAFVTTFLTYSLSFAQISVSTATGTGPVVSAGWSIGGTASAPGPHVQLTANTGSQAGQLWYNTPLNLTGCGSFVAEFDYQIITPTSTPTPSTAADGMAFWIVNPLTGFVGGGGIGLPTNPNGLVLIFDTYNNDGVGNDPLVSMYGYPAGFTGTYVEGVATNRLGFLNNQNYLYDNGWHHAKVTYAGGNVKVYLDYSATPNMSGYFPITTPGYFGFCASTGAVTSVHNVRNVYISANTISAIVGPTNVCVGTNSTYTDSTAGGTWSSTNTAVGTINASTGVFTPLTAGTTSISYTYSSTCNTGIVVTVNPGPLPAITGPASICASRADTFFNTTAGGTWVSSNPAIGTVTSTGIGDGILTPLSAGVLTLTYTLPVGCFTTRTVTINSAPPTLSFTPTPATVCDNGLLPLTAMAASTYNLFPPNGWESGVPTTAGSPVNQWTYTGGASSTWHQLNGTMATTPNIGAAHGGTYVAKFNCRSTAAGTTAAIYSPSFSMVGVGTATLTFWVYRDVSAFTGGGYAGEGVTVYVNTTAAVGGTNLGFVPRAGSFAVTGSITGTSTTGVSGWYQYTVNIPTAFTGATNYIVFSGNSSNGNNLYLDDVSLTGTVGPATWAATTWLYNDAAFTVPYTGAAQNPVYMHPTGVTVPTTITYTATVTNGTCASTGTMNATVNPNPAAITGIGLVCLGSTSTLNCTTAGGAWSSLNTTVATVNPATGVVGGAGLGTATIVYAVGTCSVTTVVTVVTSPGTITGPSIMCLGQLTTYTNPTAGGVWSSQNPLIASINPSTGVASGDALGTSIITYGIGTCYSTKPVTVNVTPGPIVGALGLCTGASTTFTATPAGGFWSSCLGVGSIGPLSGVFTAGASAGTCTITYSRSGCSTTSVVTVVTTPLPIGGTPTTCFGSTTTLTHPSPGGTWSSSNSAIASVSPTGVVTGASSAGGTATITYTVSAGCYATITVTVIASPPAPTGTMTVCVGATTTLNHATPGGTWTASCAGIANVPSLASGAVDGIGAGTCVVTYTLPSGCITTATVTVHPVPGTITGATTLCVGSSGALANATPLGSWSMACPAVGTINSSSGSWNGIGAGTCTVSYSLGTGCRTTTTVTVNPAPIAIAGTFTVCVGSTTTVTSSPLVAWVSSNTLVATVSGAGVVLGNSAGTSIISAIAGAGCYTTQVVTVIATPGAITGAPGAFSYCVGNTTTLNASPAGGTWSSSAGAIAPIVTSGVTAGTPYVILGGSTPGGTSTISYTLAGCSSSNIVTVNTAPGTIGGTLTTCVNQCTTLTNSAGGGTWTSSNAAVGTINATTGVFCGISAGTSNITYSLGSGCVSWTTVTVNALPNITGGPYTVCEGSCINISASPTLGTWSSSTTSVGTIGASTGTFCGVGAGTSVVTYTRTSTGCFNTAIVTVNALPTSITGTTTMCAGTCTTLTGLPAGGNWISGSTAVGTINSVTGQFCGLSSGTSMVSYTLPTGCRRTQVVAVDPLPTAVSGSTSVCELQCATLSGVPSGGAWSSSNPAIGSINSSGTFCGVSMGTVNITYTLPTTCALVVTRTVNSLPTPITGMPTMCVSLTTTLSSTPSGGAWSSGNTAVATIDPLTGVATGQSGTFTTTISYSLPTGCRTTTVVTVMGLPSSVGGTMQLCENGTGTVNCTPAGGTWSMACPTIGTISSTGVITGVAPGTCTVTYTLGTGCIRTATITVNAVPGPITGTAAMCVGGTTTLTSTPGGTWTSANNAIASVGSNTGVVTGNSGPLTTTIIHTNSFNCSATRVVTVYALPSAIAGSLQGCVGTTTTLSSPGTPGGTWSSSDPSVATIGLSTGVLTCTPTPITSPATTTITYTLGSGCIKTAVFTVNPLPDDILGGSSFCQAECIAVTTSTGGGVWSTGTPAVLSQSVTTPYIFCGTTAGVGTVTYTIPSTGCYKTFTTTVQPLPTAITGPSVVCMNETITLSGIPSGGSWSGGGTNVSIHPSTGVVTGMNAGTDIITYHYPVTGCILTKVVSVNPLPVAITGIDQVCVGLTTTLTNTSGGGSWQSSNSAVGTIDVSGVVTGIAPGTTLISYTFYGTGCRITRPVTVNQLPTTITGPDAYCNFSDATYNSIPGGGTWSSSNIAEVEFGTASIGIATAHGTPGVTTTITYTLPTGCMTTKDIGLILAPYDIDGVGEVCFGGCITFSNIIGGGSWSNTTLGTIAMTPVTSSSAVVCGISPGIGNVVYTLSTGCSSSKNVTVNPIPNGITGSLQVCEGSDVLLINTTTGGSWISMNPSVATVGSSTGIVSGISGGATGDTASIVYSLSTGCSATVVMTVYPLPAAISGIAHVCEGFTTTLASAPATGTWTSADPAVATVGASTGIVTGLNAYAIGTGGIGQTTITYTLPTGCLRTQNFTVNSLPAAISGISNICKDDMTVLGNPTPGGTWISSDPSIASITSVGVVTGNNPGTVVITYMLPTGCISTWPMTVNGIPDAIAGSLQVCAGFATNLTSGPSGGVWSQDPASMVFGTINPITGVVSGITAGLVPVSYTLGSGCRVVATVTVVNLPAAITGDARVCEAGGTTLLTHFTTGGIWSSSNPAMATVDPVSGLVTGIAAGTATITYTVGTGCFNIRHVTVNPLPATITGPYEVCEQSQITLANATPGGTWQSGATAIASINSGTGVLTGEAAGVAPVSYILTATGCLRSVNITVNPTPAPITGNPHICVGSAVNYASATPGGTWINSNPGVIAFVAPSPSPANVTVLPVTLGTAIITYQFGTGCRATKQVTVQPLPIVFNVTGGGSYCAGGPGVAVGVDSSQPGVSYELRRGTIAAGYISGTGFPISFGLQAAAGVYTVQATNVTSGCQRNMAGSATVIVNASVTPTVTINASPTDQVCPGETVTLNAMPTAGGTAPTYVWKVNGVTVGTGSSYSFIPSDGDIASVTMTSNGTCITTTTANMSRPLTVLPTALPVAGIIVSPNDSVCQHTPVTLIAVPEFGGTAPAYSWTLNGAPVSAASSYTYIPNNGDILNYRLTSNYRCRLANTVMSADVNMYVEPMLIPRVDVHADPGLTVAAGKPVTLTAVAWDAGASPTYQWKVNGVPVAGATNSTYTAIFNNYDSIACMVVSSGICNNIGTSDWVFITTTTSTAQLAGTHNAITLHPNPNKGQFTVRGTLAGNSNEEATMEITNMLGQVVYKGTLQVKRGKVDAQVIMDKSLANGMYLLTLHTQDGPQTFHFVMEQ